MSLHCTIHSFQCVIPQTEREREHAHSREKRDKQCTYDVTSRRVRANIVVIEKQ